MLRRCLKALLKIGLYTISCSVLYVLLLRWIPVYFTPLMAIRMVEQYSEGKPITCKHTWVNLQKISPSLQKAVIVSEDAFFLTHNGFDFTAIEKAIQNNKNTNKIKGGSTISQQTAKNVFLYPKRSYIRKILEAYFTVLIEILWSKERIMEVYLNSIEMGPGIYGAQSASEYWFKTNANKLSVSQSAALAAILPSPTKYNPVISGPYVLKRKSQIERYILSFGTLDFSKTKSSN